MIYEHFNMRLHASEYEQQEPSSWVIRTGEGILDAFSVGSILNPKPGVKTNKLDIQGTSGAVDMTEDSGRVYFENKIVTVILQGRADFYGMEDVESFFAAYQGRLVDFTTDDYLSVQKFQVGRISVEINRKQNRITLTLDTEPYRYTEEVFEKPLPLLTNYETENNNRAWRLAGGSGGGLPLVTDDQLTSFTYCFNTPGHEAYREKYVGASSGFFALGILEVVGGEICFCTGELGTGRRSKSVAEVIPLETPVDGNSGKISMAIYCDGSYYEWKTIDGVRRYLPTVRCSYILSNYLPVDSDGNITDAVSDVFDANTAIRPYVYNTSAETYVITDGVATKTTYRQGYKKEPKVMLPNIYADMSGETTKSIFVTVKPTSTSVSVSALRYRKAEVF